MITYSLSENYIWNIIVSFPHLFLPNGFDVTCKSVYWFGENIQKRASPECASQKVPGGQQKESGAFCPCDKWSALTGHFSPPQPSPNATICSLQRAGDESLRVTDLLVSTWGKTPQSPCKSPRTTAERDWTPIYIQLDSSKIFHVSSVSQRRPGNLDFEKNNIYFRTRATSAFEGTIEIFTPVFMVWRISRCQHGGAGSHFLLAAGAQNMNRAVLHVRRPSSQVSRPQNPPRRMALINGGAALMDRKDMGGPPHVYLNLFPPAALLQKYTTFWTSLPESAKHLPLSPIYIQDPWNTPSKLPSSPDFFGETTSQSAVRNWIWGREKCDCFLRRPKLKTHVWFGKPSRSRRTGRLPNRKKRLYREGRNKSNLERNALPAWAKTNTISRTLMTWCQ